MACWRMCWKVVSLCALVLGLTALASGTAQAEPLAAWNIGKANGELVQVNETNKLFAQLEIKEIESGTATLLFTTKGGTKVGILCAAVKFDEGGKLIAEGGISLSRMLLTGCVTLLNGSVSTPCKPKTNGKALGELLTEKFKGLAVLDKVGTETEDYVKFTPDEGRTFAKIELGEECSIGTLVKVETKAEGESFWLKESGGNVSFGEEKVEHLFDESLHGIIALGQPAVIDGSILVKLAGEHLGLTFARGVVETKTSAFWSVINAKGELVQVNETNKLFAQLELKEIEKQTATLSWTSEGGTKIGLLCTSAKFDEGGQLAAQGGISLSRVLLTGCVILLNGTISPACKPHTTGLALGELLTQKFIGSIVLDKLSGGAVDSFVKLVPDEGTTLLQWEPGEECSFSFGGLVKVEGELWLKDSGGNVSFQEEKVEHLVEEALHALTALHRPAVLEGSMLVGLSGGHLGLKWGGTPG